MLLWRRSSGHTGSSARPCRCDLPGGICALVRQAPGRLRAEVEGFRMGLRKRPEVWRLKAVGTLEILRWLLSGSGSR